MFPLFFPLLSCGKCARAAACGKRRIMCLEKKTKKEKEREKVSVFGEGFCFFCFFSAFLAVICLTSAAKWSRETEIPLANPALSASAGLRGACDEGSRDSVPAHDSSSWEGRKRAPKKNIHTPKSLSRRILTLLISAAARTFAGWWWLK